MKKSPTAVLLTAFLTSCVTAAAASTRDDKKKDAKPRPDLSGVWVQYVYTRGR